MENQKNTTKATSNNDSLQSYFQPEKDKQAKLSNLFEDCDIDTYNEVISATSGAGKAVYIQAALIAKDRLKK